MNRLLCLILFIPVLLSGQSLVIRNVQLVDVEKRQLLPNYSVRITDNLITEVAPTKRLKVTAKDTIIEGEGKYLLPGLIDAHIHFFQSGGLYTRPDALDLRAVYSFEEEVKFGKANVTDYLQRYLRMGITTVMDVGGPMYNYTIRDSIAPLSINPNVLVTGPLFSIVARPQLDLGDPPIIRVDTEADIDSLFKAQLPYRPDFMKVWYISSSNYPPAESFPRIKHLGDLCKQSNLLLAIHATQLETAQYAVKAGANILVHSIDDAIIPDDFVAELKAKNVTYIPTMIVSSGYGRTFTGNLRHDPQDLRWANPHAYGTLMDLYHIDTALWPGRLKNIFGREWPAGLSREDSIMQINLKKLNKAGVNIATGTDAGNIGTMHASSYLAELSAMQSAGLNNWDLLVASTLNPAKGFGKVNELGSIAKGKRADMILLKENPLENIQSVNEPVWVIKSGQVLMPDEIHQESPEQLVQRQLNAYNARNIDAFMATYAENIEIYDFNGDLLMKGQDPMRTRYQSMFENTPNLHCELVNRIVMGSTVIDQEHVRVGDRFIDAVAIYTLADGKISQVTFVRP